MSPPSHKALILAVLLPVLALAALFALQIARLSKYISRGSYDIKPYQQPKNSPTLRFLFLGDSTAVGTGTPDNRQSVAGYFGQDFPGAEIVNDSYNGRRLHQLLTEFEPKAGDHYDLAVIQIGGNDILKFTPFSDVAADIPALLKKVGKVADHTVLLHSGNVGESLVFIWPFNWLMTRRTLELRDIYIREAAKAHAVYIDLFKQLKGNPLVVSPAFYGPDFLHPGPLGYHIWYDQIRLALKNAHINLSENPSERRP